MIGGEDDLFKKRRDASPSIKGGNIHAGSKNDAYQYMCKKNDGVPQRVLHSSFKKSTESSDKILQPESLHRSVSEHQYMKEIDVLSVQSIRLRNSPKTTVTQLSNYDLLRSRSSSLTELRSRSSSSLESSGARARLPSGNSSLEYFLNSPQSSMRTINSPSSNSNRVMEIPHQTMLFSHSLSSPLAAQRVLTSPLSRYPSVDVPVQKMSSSPNRNNSSTTGHHSSNEIPTKKLPGTPHRIPDDLIGKIGSHTTIYLVQFRHIIKDCVNKGPFNLKKGDFVMVQCDRGGQDMGVVVDVVSLGQYLADREAEIANSSSPLEPTTIDVISLPAIPEQIARLTQKNVDEENALSTIKNMVSASHINMNMKITGVEFQFDRQKLTVYYTSNERIHFNDLVKTLFNAFKTRVWMKKTNQSRVFQERMWARAQLATGYKLSHSSDDTSRIVTAKPDIMQPSNISNNVNKSTITAPSTNIISTIIKYPKKSSPISKLDIYLLTMFFGDWLSIVDCCKLDIFLRGQLVIPMFDRVIKRIMSRFTDYIVTGTALFNWLKNKDLSMIKFIKLEFTNDYLTNKSREIKSVYCYLQHIKITELHQSCMPALIEILISMADNVNELIISNSACDMSALVFCVAAYCPNITTVDFSNCVNLSEQCIVNLCMCCMHLQSLTLANCIRIGDRAIESVTVHCNCLHSIDISGCTNVTKSSIMTICYYSRKPLRNIAISDIRLSDFVLRMVIYQCGSVLCSLNVSVSIVLSTATQQPYITDKSIQQITATICPVLTHLNISGNEKITDIGVTSLAMNLSTLQSLHICHLYALTSRSLSAFAECCSQLRRLSINNYNNQYDKQSIAYLMSKRKDLKLVIGGDVVVGLSTILEELKQSAKEHSLHSLDLSFSKFDCDELISSFDLFGHGILFIRLSDCVYSNHLLSTIAIYCAQLVNIDLSNSKTISDYGITQLVQYCTAIESMILTGCMNLTSKSMYAIGKWCKHIHTLHIPENVRHISIDSLEFVLLHCYKLHVIYMSYMHTTSDMWRGRYSIVHTFTEDLVEFRLRMAENSCDDECNENHVSSSRDSSNITNSHINCNNINEATTINIAGNNTNIRFSKESIELLKRRQVVFKWQLSEHGSF